MDDFVVNVRQITQYPEVGQAQATDALLLQAGGLGGPSQWTSPAGVVAGRMESLTNPVFFSSPMVTFAHDAMITGTLHWLGVGMIQTGAGMIFAGSGGDPVLTLGASSDALLTGN